MCKNVLFIITGHQIIFFPMFPTVVIHKTGHFYKTAAINEAAATVKDDNSIIFLLDLHLDLPVNLIHTIRKVSYVYILK